jgi:FkbM family methyltransferase
MFKAIFERLKRSSAQAAAAASRYPNPDFDPAVHRERVTRWQAANSDEKFRTHYDRLNKNSIVLDLGGYHGDYALLMNGKYGATCHVFEVIPELCEHIRRAINGNEKIKIHAFGLAGNSRSEKLFLAEEGSSTFCDRSESTKQISIELVRASDWFKSELRGTMVDLMKINTEGGEYELLEHMLDNDIVRQVRNIQVQFHEDVVINASQRMEKIHSKLVKTHHLTFQERFVWENWELNEPTNAS